MANAHGMTGITIVVDGDGASQGEAVRRGQIEKVTALAGGMHSGKPSVAILVRDLESGKLIMGETSLVLFLSAAEAFMARHGDPRVPGWTPPAPPEGTFPKA